jgi:TorA maturation chaperone TorD
MFTLGELKFAIVSAALICAIGGSYFYGRNEQKTADQLVAAKQEQVLQQQINTETDRRNQIATDFENKLDNLKIVNTTVNRTVTQELTKQIYTDCKLPDSGVALINNSADQLNAVRHGSAPVAASQ